MLTIRSEIGPYRRPITALSRVAKPSRFDLSLFGFLLPPLAFFFIRVFPVSSADEVDSGTS
jgi:hypothetical protein